MLQEKEIIKYGLIMKDELSIGWYLSIYEEGFCIHDSLQDVEALAKKEALEGWGIPVSAWK